ncbi:DinB family protein [Nonlabens xiamenensis]|uniref:DinB family protein n=1 Tax=Nonlabens xiamenensis TaxID=2341043 RepID=UPI000F60FA9F|nr:DinB family protein [Nonlabens xiamenensis]
MKLLPLIVMLGVCSILQAQTADYKTAFIEKWNNSKQYLIQVAEAMPEEAYDYKPTPRQKSFKEQLLHIQANINWLSGTYLTVSSHKGNQASTTSAVMTKKELIASLAEAFDESLRQVVQTPTSSLSKTVDFFAGPKSKLQILQLMQDHVTHHRGQLLVYLNLKGVTPPTYVGW